MKNTLPVGIETAAMASAHLLHQASKGPTDSGRAQACPVSRAVGTGDQLWNGHKTLQDRVDVTGVA